MPYNLILGSDRIRVTDEMSLHAIDTVNAWLHPDLAARDAHMQTLKSMIHKANPSIVYDKDEYGTFTERLSQERDGKKVLKDILENAAYSQGTVIEKAFRYAIRGNDDYF